MKGQLKLSEVVFFAKDDPNPELDDSNICFFARQTALLKQVKLG